jgi:hypothetical protein
MFGCVGEAGGGCRNGSAEQSPLCGRFSKPGEAPRFAGKGQGNCTWSMPDETMRRSFSQTAAGKLAGVEGLILPPGRGARTPLQKLGPPPTPPVFAANGAAHVHRTVDFSP